MSFSGKVIENTSKLLKTSDNFLLVLSERDEICGRTTQLKHFILLKSDKWWVK